MAILGEATIKVDYEMTETSKEVLKPLIAQVIREAPEGGGAVFPSEEALRAFVREEVRKALQVARDFDLRPARAYTPPHMETKELPAWARPEETGGAH